MKNKYPFICSCFILIITVSSCSIQKRRYMQGYNLQWKKGNDVGDNALKQKTTGEESIFPVLPTEEIEFTASAGAKEISLLSKSSPFSQKWNSKARDIATITDGCDIIVLRSGEEIQAKVSEINPENIKYKACNNPDGPLITLNKSDVSMVRYSNGTQDVFPYEPKRQTISDEARIEKKIKHLSILSLIFSILSFIPFYGIPFGILAIIFSSGALHKMKKNAVQDPKIKRIATIALCISIAGTIVSLGVSIWIIVDSLSGFF
jgi:hypothetical protein